MNNAFLKLLSLGGVSKKDVPFLTKMRSLENKPNQRSDSFENMSYSTASKRSFSEKRKYFDKKEIDVRKEIKSIWCIFLQNC